jgi:hypothetical protein
VRCCQPSNEKTSRLTSQHAALHLRAEHSRLDPSSAFDLHKDSIVSRLRKSVFIG